MRGIEEFWDALDWIRLQKEKPWRASFRVAFGKLLPIRERLALPGMARSTRFVGGDATLDRLGAADWKALKYHSEPCQRYVVGGLVVCCHKTPQFGDELFWKLKVGVPQTVKNDTSWRIFPPALQDFN